MNKPASHVEPNIKSGWSVRSSGSSRAARVFRTKEEAIKAGKKIAKEHQSMLYIHDEDGSVREKRSFANEPALK